MPASRMSQLPAPRSGAVRRSAGAVALTFALALVAGFAPPAKADSLSGLFLAARHAESVPDYSAAARLYRRALQRSPDERMLMSSALRYTVASGQIVRGVRIAEQLNRLEPDNRIALLTLIADDVRNERFEDARARLKDAPDGALTDFVRSLLGAWIDEGAGDSAAADTLLATEDDDALLNIFRPYHAGLMATLRGDDRRAVSWFEAAVKAGGKMTSRLAIAYGAPLERSGDTAGAEKLYQQVLEDDPQDPNARAALERLKRGEPAPLLVESPAAGAAEVIHGLGAVLSGQDGGRSMALIYAQLALYMNPDFTAAQLLVGSLLDDLNQHADAADAFDKVPATSPSFVVAQMGRARALTAMGMKDAALDALQQIVDANRATANVYFSMGEIYSGEEHYGECARSYENGLERLSSSSERHWVYLFSRGICLERIGDWPGAEKSFEQALELEPNQPDVLNYLGYSLVEQGVRFEQARDMIERAVQARPQSGYIVDSLGWVLYRIGDYQGAVQELERAVSLTPVEPVINDHFGDALWMVGRKMEARFQWRRALSFKPEDKDRTRIERKLAVGLDEVRAEEAAAETEQPAKAEATPKTPNEPAQGG